jgi:hypothetical protein
VESMEGFKIDVQHRRALLLRSGVTIWLLPDDTRLPKCPTD